MIQRLLQAFGNVDVTPENLWLQPAPGHVRAERLLNESRRHILGGAATVVARYLHCLEQRNSEWELCSQIHEMIDRVHGALGNDIDQPEVAVQLCDELEDNGDSADSTPLHAQELAV